MRSACSILGKVPALFVFAAAATSLALADADDAVGIVDPMPSLDGLGDAMNSLGRSALFLGLLVIAGLFAVRFVRARAAAAPKHVSAGIEIIETRRLDAKRSLHLVCASGAEVLVCVSDHAAAMIELPKHGKRGAVAPVASDSTAPSFEALVRNAIVASPSEDQACRQ